MFLVKILVNQPIDMTKHEIEIIFHFNVKWTFNDENELIVITFKKLINYFQYWENNI
jgi:hypothetical protein